MGLNDQQRKVELANEAQNQSLRVLQHLFIGWTDEEQPKQIAAARVKSKKRTVEFLSR